MKFLVCLVICGVLIGGTEVAAQSRIPSQRVEKNDAQAIDRATKEIRVVLDSQVAAWNRGDLEGFMAGYWRSPGLTFTSGTNLTNGWDETLARYKKRYQGEGKEMGTLSFEEITIEILGEKAAFVRGKWKLQMKESAPGGRFTLVVRRFPEGWRVIHDHTS